MVTDSSTLLDAKADIPSYTDGTVAALVQVAELLKSEGDDLTFGQSGEVLG
jgi:hypothetical protein